MFGLGFFPTGEQPDQAGGSCQVRQVQKSYYRTIAGEPGAAHRCIERMAFHLQVGD